tara:strand:- start:429 stop:620 length:192 start_codon:yes stop_codon:yes gene_type:complete
MTKITLLSTGAQFEAVGMEKRDGLWFLEAVDFDRKWVPLYEAKCNTNLIDLMNHEKIFIREKI